jgi:peptidoglycan L-alanyl-D-glutamate endopeptidase CwlK
MDQISIQRISQAHPDIRQTLLQQYKEANKLLGKGARLRFAYVYRTPAEQDILFNKRPKVTNAKGWQSIHNFGLAFDIVLLYDNDGNGTFEEASWSQIKDFDKDSKADWKEIVTYFKSKGWEHGGDWKNFKDQPHFQLKKPNETSYKWQELKAKIEAGDTINDSNGVVYPKL